MRKILASIQSFAIGTLLLATGCANQSAVKSECPKTPDQFANNTTTVDEVKTCFGNPDHEDDNSDGRFVYLYNTKDSTVYACLFDSKGVLTRVSVYKDSNNP